MTLFVISLIILVSILLVLVILAQNPKGGLSSQFGGSGTSNIIGVKKTTDLLENITWSLAIGLFVLALSINFMTESTTQGYTSPNIERAQEQLVVTSLDLDANEDAATSSEEPQGLDDLIEDQE